MYLFGGPCIHTLNPTVCSHLSHPINAIYFYPAVDQSIFAVCVVLFLQIDETAAGLESCSSELREMASASVSLVRFVSEVMTETTDEEREELDAQPYQASERIR